MKIPETEQPQKHEDKLKIDGEILTDEELDNLSEITDADIAEAINEFDAAVPQKFRGMIG